MLVKIDGDKDSAFVALPSPVPDNGAIRPKSGVLFVRANLSKGNDPR